MKYWDSVVIEPVTSVEPWNVYGIEPYSPLVYSWTLVQSEWEKLESFYLTLLTSYPQRSMELVSVDWPKTPKMIG